MRLLAFLTALFALVWADGVARAEPTVRVAVEEYPVLGRTGGEIMKEINRKGPRHGFLVRAIAQTRYALDYRYEAVETAGSCRVASATVELDIAYVYPRLDSKVPSVLQRRWHRFLKEVRAHEEVHGDLARRMAREAEAGILAMSAQGGCKALEHRIEREVKRIFERYEAEQRRFDRDEHRKGGNVDAIVDRLVK